MKLHEFEALEVKHFRNLDHYEMSISYCKVVARDCGKWSAEYLDARKKRYSFAVEYHSTLEQVSSERQRLYCERVPFGTLLYRNPSHYYIS